MSSKAYTGFGSLRESGDDRSLTEFIVQQMMNGLATATLVKVKAVTGGTVDAQPMVAQIDGAGNALPHGTVHGMPWFALRAGASVIMASPKVGDIGLAVFCHNDISSAKKNKAPSNPGSRRRFDWADGVYMGGLLGPTPTTIIAVDDATGVTITVPSGKTITLNGSVQINGDVAMTGALNQTGDQTVSGTLTATTDVVGGGKSLKTHTHGGITTGSGTSGPPS